jgi:hypothetical protein
MSTAALRQSRAPLLDGPESQMKANWVWWSLPEVGKRIEAFADVHPLLLHLALRFHHVGLRKLAAETADERLVANEREHAIMVRPN